MKKDQTPRQVRRGVFDSNMTYKSPEFLVSADDSAIKGQTHRRATENAEFLSILCVLRVSAVQLFFQ
jgi:hypothetical protein